MYNIEYGSITFDNNMDFKGFSTIMSLLKTIFVPLLFGLMCKKDNNGYKFVFVAPIIFKNS